VPPPPPIRSLKVVSFAPQVSVKLLPTEATVAMSAMKLVISAEQ